MPALNPLLVLLGLTVAVSVYAWSNRELLDNWILDPYHMHRGGSSQLYRLLTCGFLHADWGHLLFNMLAFYSFGNLVLGVFAGLFGPSGGTLRFLLLYLGGIVLSSLPSYLQHRSDPGYRSLGASGGVASVLFAGILFNPTGEIGMMFIPIGIPGFLWGVLYLIYSQYMSHRRLDNTNHDAHFYGAVYGIVVALALVPAAGPVAVSQVLAYLKNLL